MDSPKYLFATLCLALFSIQVYAIKFDITNNCPYTVWAAAKPGGGRRLDRGQTWTVARSNLKITRIWGRTNCTFDSSGRGRCLTGDCNGALECQTLGTAPYTMAEYGLNTFARKDFYYVNLLNGFNLPIALGPTSNGCTKNITCASADILTACPRELRTPGGCHNPCTVFKTPQYCCHAGSCRPTEYSRFFKKRCRDCFTYPEDDPTATFTCPAGTNYKVVFCP